MDFGRILVLSPHRDDEVLGVGGTLLQHTSIHIHYFNDKHPNVIKEVYDREAVAVATRLDCAVSYTNYPAVNHLGHFPIHIYIAEIEEVIEKVNPTTIFIPHPDYNQDHRVVYDAAITAVRTHDEHLFVNNVLLYEQPETHTPAYGSQFIPQLFVPINIKEKLELYSLYASQVRGHRSEEHLKALAQLRGMQCERPFAEAFQVVRIRA